MMAGALIQVASERRILLINGFIASSALLVAERLAPGAAQYAIFVHHSVEPGQAHLLKLLNAKPLLDMGKPITMLIKSWADTGATRLSISSRT